MSDERRWFLSGVVDALCVVSLTWLIMEIVSPEGEGVCPPQLAGFAAAIIGMVAGSYIFKKKTA